jgi:hypothetical protein
MTSIDPKKWTRETLEKHSVDMRQFIDFRQSTLPNGMRIIEAYNSSGLTFTILPDRGMDIWTAHYKGIPLTWISQGSPHPPDWGQSWLRQFNGGLLTTCGLTHVGPPEVDDITGEQRDIHGNFTRLRSEISMNRGYWDEKRGYTVELHGQMSENRLFGEQLVLERWIRIRLGEPTIELLDTVQNVGDEPTPLMMLYHINFGFPLIQEKTQLITASNVYPRDEAARKGLDRWMLYDKPEKGYPEQVFYHHHYMDDDEYLNAALVGEDVGVMLEWRSEQLPYFTQWKNTRQGIYVCSMEPGNCIPEGQNAARKNGRLQMIQPGEFKYSSFALSILEGKDETESLIDLIEEKKHDGNLAPNVKLDDYAQS